MNDKNTSKVSDEDLRKAFVGETKADEPAKSSKSQTKNKSIGLENKFLVMLIAGIVAFVLGLTMLIVALVILNSGKTTDIASEASSLDEDTAEYSLLTGEKLAEGEAKDAPVFCVQTPNGLDGARPQSGLNEAGVIFEAIAEAGITRFAAIYQDPSAAVIGPIRSLRSYYLEWDTPFDCTIVHAGGSGDALAAISAGGYRDLTEDYQYMYRGTYGGSLWNNLFTTAAQLKQFDADHGYTKSDVKGFTRYTPAESERVKIDELVVEKLDITRPAKGNTSETKPPVSAIAINFGGLADFNLNYNYDAASNTYLRSYASGNVHSVYACPAENLGERNPEDVCTLTQMAPSVVIAIVVQESRAADNYHENITTVGSGDAYIFQNGAAIRGTWKKGAVDAQIEFLDGEGNTIKLAPGQTIISAIPGYGSVAF